MSDLPHRVPVWDLPLRLFHWMLLTSVVAAAISGFLLPLNWLNLHVIAGTAIIVLLLFRLVWGFTGSGFSRFSSFLFLPRTVLAHVQALRRGETPHYLGHNPVGSVMIFALLTVLALLAITGTIVLGGAEKQGVLKAIVSYATGSFTRELHELLAYGLLAWCWSSPASSESRPPNQLARSMVNGDKLFCRCRWLPPRIGAAAAGAGRLRPRLLCDVRLPAGVPRMGIRFSYAAVRRCHIPFHPSLRGPQLDRLATASTITSARRPTRCHVQQLSAMAQNAERWDTAPPLPGPEPAHH
jgi:cytochrome b